MTKAFIIFVEMVIDLSAIGLAVLALAIASAYWAGVLM